MKKNRGFTLIELLAVIVVLGIIMLIAVTSVSGVIEKSRKDVFVDTARAYIDAVKKKIVLENISLPATIYDDIMIYLDKTMVEKGGINSPYGRSYTILDHQPVTQNDYDSIDNLNINASTIVSHVVIQCRKDETNQCNYQYAIFLSDGVQATIGDDCWNGYGGVIWTIERNLDTSSIQTIASLPECAPPT